MVGNPEGRVRVLVLCHANVARSVAAAALLEGARDERGAQLEIRTAGTHATNGQPPSIRTVNALKAVTGRDLLLGAHRASILQDEDASWADLIIAMEDSQVQFVRRRHPEAVAKVATIAVLASTLPEDSRPLRDRIASMELDGIEGDGADDVEDPAGGDAAAYERAMTVLAEHCAQLARRLAS
jgi:protein-tyrosine-phosphatase